MEIIISYISILRSDEILRCWALSYFVPLPFYPGMNKMIINHLDKLFVTSDAATIVSELEVQHPAAKLLVLAAKAQQEEVGDGANLVITLAGELLQGAEDLIKSGLHPSEIITGYAKATEKVGGGWESGSIYDTI